MTAAARLGAFVAGTGSFWMPRQGSTMAGEVDRLFYLILGISIFFFLLISGLVIFFVIRYRRPHGSGAVGGARQHLALELTWTVIPLVIVLVIFALGLRAVLRLTTLPSNAYEVEVVAQKWAWAFRYPNGYEDADLHVPVNRPILLRMNSPDVIHSFFVPDFRIKQDVIPGRYTKVWFEATEPGEHVLYCAEYCGTGHSEMISRVVVHAAGEFEPWLDAAAASAGSMDPVALGGRLHTVKGCGQCHSTDGSGGIGPSFQGIYGAKRVFADGSSAEADENYLRESILNPQARVSAGYEPVMPTYQGRLDEREISALIEFIKSPSE